jgi:hypothetical protein
MAYHSATRREDADSSTYGTQEATQQTFSSVLSSFMRATKPAALVKDDISSGSVTSAPNSAGMSGSGVRRRVGFARPCVVTLCAVHGYTRFICHLKCVRGLIGVLVACLGAYA